MFPKRKESYQACTLLNRNTSTLLSLQIQIPRPKIKNLVRKQVLGIVRVFKLATVGWRFDVTCVSKDTLQFVTSWKNRKSVKRGLTVLCKKVEFFRSSMARMWAGSEKTAIDKRIVWLLNTLFPCTNNSQTNNYFTRN